MWHFFPPHKNEMKGNGASEEAGQGRQVGLGHQEDRAKQKALGRERRSAVWGPLRGRRSALVLQRDSPVLPMERS